MMITNINIGLPKIPATPAGAATSFKNTIV
jgi:hypothetical protein